MTRLQTFSEKMTRHLGKVHEVKSAKDLPKKVVEIAKALGVKKIPVAAAVKDLEKLNAQFRAAKISDVLGISRADFGIAETGTLVFCSSSQTPPSLNFVPEFSIAIVNASDIVSTSEDVWARLKDKLPRTLNMISGPSKTGDIEQTMFLGAHGPRELHVIIVKN